MRFQRFLPLLATLPGVLATNFSACANSQQAPQWYGPQALESGSSADSFDQGECGYLRNRQCNYNWSPAPGYVDKNDMGMVYAFGDSCICGKGSDAMNEPPGEKCGRGAVCYKGKCFPNNLCKDDNQVLKVGASGSIGCYCGITVFGQKSTCGSCPAFSLPSIVYDWNPTLDQFVKADCQCVNGFESLGGQCIKACQSTETRIDGKCMPTCPYGQEYFRIRDVSRLEYTCRCNYREGFWGTELTCGGCNNAYAGTCRLCPAGCSPYDNSGNSSGIGGGCDCGDSKLFIRSTNTAYDCPADRHRRSIEMQETPNSADSACGCKAATFTKPDGSSFCTACTGLNMVLGSDGMCTCPTGTALSADSSRCDCPSDALGGALRYDSAKGQCGCAENTFSKSDGSFFCTSCTGNNMVLTDKICACPAGTMLTSDSKNCNCPDSRRGFPQIFNPSTPGCQECTGMAVVSDKGTCDCLPGAVITPSDGICRCDNANGFATDSTGKQCSACGVNQAINQNGQCGCDTSKGYTDTGGGACRACPSGSTALDTGAQCQCSGNAYFDKTTFTCIICPSGTQNINGQCQQPPISCQGRNSQVDVGNKCKCAEGYTADIPGDTSSSLTCSNCGSGRAINFRSQQCAPCPLDSGRVVTNGVCQCNTDNSYGLSTASGYFGGSFFTCLSCPTDATAVTSLTYNSRGEQLPGCVCKDNSKELLVDSASGQYYCGVYAVPTCADPSQTYITGIKACAGPCPPHSTLDSSGRCRCDQTYTAADPKQVSSTTLECVQCASNQFIPYPNSGCYCSSTYKLGPCPPTASTLPRRNYVACPVGHDYCPGDNAKSGTCLDPASISTCGGCRTGPYGHGVDCGELANADVVSCIFGRCVIESCNDGFIPATNRSSCIVGDENYFRLGLSEWS